jgi:hypothetical protein
MPAALTEVDTFTSSVSVPVAGDPREAASVVTGFQALANRTRNLLGRHKAAVFAVSGSKSAGSAFDLAPHGGSTSFVLASDQVQVPMPGTYLIRLQGRFRSDDTGANPEIGALIVIGGAPYVYSTSVRSGTSTSTLAASQIETVAEITDPATQLIRVNPYDGGVGGGTNITVDPTVVSPGATITIQQIGG